MVLSYVRRALGEEAVGRVLALAGEHRSAPALSGPGSWGSRDDILAIAEAAALVCGDPEIGRRSGEEMMRVAHERGTVDFVRATGTVAAALEMTTNLGTKMSNGRCFEVGEVGENHALLIATYQDHSYGDPFFCGQAAGYYGLIPEIFGYSGVITEPECMCRGDERCLYRLTWTATEARDEPTMAEVEASRARADGFVQRFEHLHVMATELARAEEVDTLLARIAELAGFAIDAPAYLLAVRDHEGSHLRIHHRGFSEDRAARYAERLLSGELEQNERCLIADVASSGSHYGRLAAWYPKGSSVTDMDRRLLHAYARHAAAALEAVASLQGARHDRDTAEAFLSLAQALARVGSRLDVARRLAAAVPAVAACQVAGVWLWDPARESLHLAAQFPEDDASARAQPVLSTADVDRLAELVKKPAPFVVHLDEAVPVVRSMMEAAGLRRCAVVPMVARGTFLGAVAAGFAQEPAADEQPVLDRLGGLAHQAATALDNADLLERLREQALHDSLTGLPNRTLLEDRARQALLRLTRAGHQVSLLFVDLDRFKNINDTLGHEVGDALIRDVGTRLGDCLRASDTLARLGGDEFVALLSDSSTADAAKVADRMLLALRRPFAIGGRDLFISCSIGIASAPDHGADYATLLRHADRAMYKAKEAGRSTHAVHSDDPLLPRQDRLALEGQLHTAIDRQELRLLYQPQIDLHTMRIVGVEALLRWDHPGLGRLGPDQFIPLAEESGLIAEIDEWVRENAFAQARAWTDVGMPLRMAVNLSTRVLRDPRLSSHVADLLRRYRLSPEQVELEVTDRVVISDDELPAVLEPLKALGVRLAVDDFGTGTSVLGRLQSGAIDTLKIDRSFVAVIESASGDAPVVSALLSIARNFGLEVVGEGVETAAQGAFLRRHGCHMAQGFFFSAPVEAGEIERLVQRRLGPLAVEVGAGTPVPASGRRSGA
jgi:diguanylate cyclase (GGDEF)-like protein